MYSYGEIQFQNQQDCFTGLLLILGKNLMSVMGRRGETIIRKAVCNFGFYFGKKTREKLTASGKRPNLKELAVQEDIFLDPRFRILPIRVRQQELWAEVHTCPIADYMKGHNAGGIGLMFCEEFCHAFFKGYSGGIAQANLSKTLMGPYDNHCRFSIYYRPANLEAADRERVFDLSTTQEEAVLPPRERLHSTESLREGYLMLYSCFYDVAGETGGSEGLCAIAMGLRELAGEQKAALERWAEARRRDADEAFIEENFPVSLKEGEKVLSAYLDEEQEKFFRENFLSRF